MKRLRAEAYQSLRNALPVIHWFKKALESFLRDALRHHPEILAGLDFNGPTKREIADAVISRLVADEAAYQQTTLDLMLDIAGMSRFPDIERIEDDADRDRLLRGANDAVGQLRVLTAPYREEAEARARVAAAKASDVAKITHFADDLEALRMRYLELSSSADPHQRGKDLEVLLTDLFSLFDMQPRLDYRLPHEQIDGSLSFDTDDYIVEARWRSKKAEPEDLDKLKAKVERKGRNTLGLFVSIEGFTEGALALYSRGSPFVVFNGDDIYLVLDGSIRLDDLLRAKKRHVNDSGECFIAARTLLNE